MFSHIFTCLIYISSLTRILSSPINSNFSANTLGNLCVVLPRTGSRGGNHFPPAERKIGPKRSTPPTGEAEN